MSRVPNTETANRRIARVEREQRQFLDSFDRQVAALEEREAKSTAPPSDAPKGSEGQ